VSDETWGFATPPFKPEDALQRLKRDLREVGLAEREGRFERRGLAIARAAIHGQEIEAAVVRRPARTSPEWQAHRLKSAADVRDFVAHLKKQLAAWNDSDD
jgi:aspartate aminotransferase-like enzyme